MEGYDTLHDLLVKLFNEIMNIEEKAIITEEFKDISNNEPRSMSSVAKDLSVTVGTLTIAINNLVKKAYVKRVRSEKDRRVVLISLTEKGVKAYHHHAEFHDEMIKATLNGLDEEQTKVLVKALTNLSTFFRTYGK